MNDRNFLADYRLYTAGDESPENYHLWSCLSVLASITGRRVWTNWGRFVVYPNLYVVLLGPPGNGKTTAMSIGKGLVRELGDIPFSAQAQTKESLVREMTEYERKFDYKGKPMVYTPVSIFVTELSHFLGPASGHMIDFLTTIFGEDVYDNKTKNKGNDLIIGPCVNLLACTTPAWITTYLRSDIISGGFTRRAIFINEDEGTTRAPFPELSVDQVAARERLLLGARRVASVAGEFVWDSSAKEFFANWYKTYQLPVDLSIRWYHRTKHIQIIKVAMLVALGETDELVLKLHHIQVAMGLLERIETNLARVFQGMGRNELHTVSQKLIDVLTIAGGWLPEKQVLVSMGRDANMQELYHVIDYLEKTDAVVKFNETRNGTTKRMLGIKRLVDAELSKRTSLASYTASDAPAAQPTSAPPAPTASDSSSSAGPPNPQ